MSVYIKGMEMPTGCVKCLLNSDSKCLIMPNAGYDETNGSERRHDCPLIPVPEHGRLGDLDLLTKVLKAKAKNPLNQETTPYSWAFAYECLADALGDMPTIIPADHIGDVNEMVTDKEGEG